VSLLKFARRNDRARVNRALSEFRCDDSDYSTDAVSSLPTQRQVESELAGQKNDQGNAQQQQI
jgi:hypothetical protein